MAESWPSVRSNRDARDSLGHPSVVDLERQLILFQSARQAPWNDCANLPALVAQAHAHTPPVGCVLADAEFDSERNHTFVRQQLHALSIIPLNAGQRRGPFMASELKCDRFPQAKILSSCVD